MNIFKNRPLATCCFVFLVTFYFCGFLPFLVKVFLSLIAVIIGILFMRRKAYVSVLALIFILSSAYGAWFYDSHISRAENVNDGLSEFKVIDIGYCNEDIAYVDGKDASGFKYHYTINDPPDIRCGDILKGYIRYSEIKNNDDYDTKQYYNSKDMWLEAEVDSPEIIGHKDNFIISVTERIRSYCIRSFEKHTDKSTSGILSALSVGDKSNIDESVRLDFKRSGVSHVIAISGMHLSIIMGTIGVITYYLAVPFKFRKVLIMLMCVSYMFIAGLSTSVIRAGIMFIMVALADLVGEESDPFTSLMISVSLIIIFSPCSVFDIGLILSFTSTFGIVIMLEHYMGMPKSRHRPFSQKLKDLLFASVLTSVSALALSFLPLIKYFNSISLISVPANLLIAPIVTLLLMAIPVFLLLSPIPYAGGILGVLLEYVTMLFVKIVEFLSSLPFSSVSLEYPFVKYTYIAILVGAALIFVIRKHYTFLFPYLCWFLTFCILLIFFNIPLLSSIDVVFYSDYSSDAIFVKNLKGNIYFDMSTGSEAAEKRAFGEIGDRLYANEIDYWVVTNYTDDLHLCADEMMNSYYIRNVYLPKPYDDISYYVSKELEYYAAKEKVKVVYYNYGVDFEIGNIEVNIYTPIWFETNNVYIPSLELRYGEREIFYAGRGYFEEREPRDDYDVLFLGDCGSKRNLKPVDELRFDEGIAAHGVKIKPGPLCGRLRRLTPNIRYVKLRMKNIY